jgi:spore coat protein A, manganese oxidase
LVQYIGTNTPYRTTAAGAYYGRPYVSAPTETATEGDVEIWEIANLTGDTHPIHIHLVNAQLLCRIPFDPLNYNGAPVFVGTPNTVRGPDATELGWKETFRMNPGEVIYLIMQFNLPGVPFILPTSPRIKAITAGQVDGDEYVYHCHILEHEEHDMMRPLVVIPKQPV